MSKLISTNPAKNYEFIGSVKVSTVAEIKQKVEAAQKAKTSWKESGVAKRISLLWPVYEAFLKRREEIKNLIVQEIGKASQDVESEIDRYSENFKWFLENGEKSLGVEINNANHWLTCNPFGGYKESGMGREHGKIGFQELTQVKVISMEK